MPCSRSVRVAGHRGSRRPFRTPPLAPGLSKLLLHEVVNLGVGHAALRHPSQIGARISSIDFVPL